MRGETLLEAQLLGRLCRRTPKRCTLRAAQRALVSKQTNQPESRAWGQAQWQRSSLDPGSEHGQVLTHTTYNLPYVPLAQGGPLVITVTVITR